MPPTLPISNTSKNYRPDTTKQSPIAPGIATPPTSCATKPSRKARPSPPSEPNWRPAPTPELTPPGQQQRPVGTRYRPKARESNEPNTSSNGISSTPLTHPRTPPGPTWYSRQDAIDRRLAASDRNPRLVPTGPWSEARQSDTNPPSGVEMTAGVPIEILLRDTAPGPSALYRRSSRLGPLR